jgi:large subunit ribosomal protein L20
MKKRDMRRLWISRINAAARICGVSYSVLIGAMEKAQITINRKMLAEIAVTDMGAFKKIVEATKA